MVATTYMAACQDINNAVSRQAEHHRGALMHLVAAQGGAVMLLAKPQGTFARKQAIDTIYRLDPPSSGMLYERVVPLSLDAWLSETRMHLGGADQVWRGLGTAYHDVLPCFMQSCLLCGVWCGICQVFVSCHMFVAMA